MDDQSAVNQSLQKRWRCLNTKKKKKSSDGVVLSFALPEADRASEQQNMSDHTQSGFTDCKECEGREGNTSCSVLPAALYQAESFSTKRHRH